MGDLQLVSDKPTESATLPAIVESPALPTPYAGIAAQPFTEEQQKLLAEPIPDPDLDILPTGEIYASQVRYRRILNKAFGAGGWALMPRGPFGMKGSTMMREYALIIGARFVAESIGEQEYIENNERMSYATASEGVKSNALVRCCKDIGIASECWDKHFADKFKAEHCVQVKCNVKGKIKYQWRLKSSPPLADEENPIKCPNCGKATLMHTKANPEDWWCNKYKDGCGGGFKKDDPKIVSQMTAGEHVELDDPPPPEPEPDPIPERDPDSKAYASEKAALIAAADEAFGKGNGKAWCNKALGSRGIKKWGDVTYRHVELLTEDMEKDPTSLVNKFVNEGRIDPEPVAEEKDIDF